MFHYEGGEAANDRSVWLYAKLVRGAYAPLIWKAAVDEFLGQSIQFMQDR